MAYAEITYHSLEKVTRFAEGGKFQRGEIAGLLPAQVGSRERITIQSTAQGATAQSKPMIARVVAPDEACRVQVVASDALATVANSMLVLAGTVSEPIEVPRGMRLSIIAND